MQTGISFHFSSDLGDCSHRELFSRTLWDPVMTMMDTEAVTQEETIPEHRTSPAGVLPPDEPAADAPIPSTPIPPTTKIKPYPGKERLPNGMELMPEEDIPTVDKSRIVGFGNEVEKVEPEKDSFIEAVKKLARKNSQEIKDEDISLDDSSEKDDTIKKDEGQDKDKDNVEKEKGSEKKSMVSSMKERGNSVISSMTFGLDNMALSMGNAVEKTGDVLADSVDAIGDFFNVFKNDGKKETEKEKGKDVEADKELVGNDEDDDEKNNDEKEKKGKKKEAKPKEVEKKSWGSAAQIVEELCTIRSTRVVPTVSQLDYFCDRVSGLKANEVVSEIQGQLSYSSGNAQWQPRLRVLHGIAALHENGMGVLFTKILKETEDLITVLVKVEECKEIAEKVLELKEVPAPNPLSEADALKRRRQRRRQEGTIAPDANLISVEETPSKRISTPVDLSILDFNTPAVPSNNNMMEDILSMDTSITTPTPNLTSSSSQAVSTSRIPQTNNTFDNLNLLPNPSGINVMSSTQSSTNNGLHDLDFSTLVDTSTAATASSYPKLPAPPVINNKKEDPFESFASFSHKNERLSHPNPNNNNINGFHANDPFTETTFDPFTKVTGVTGIPSMRKMGPADYSPSIDLQKRFSALAVDPCLSLETKPDAHFGFVSDILDKNKNKKST